MWECCTDSPKIYFLTIVPVTTSTWVEVTVTFTQTQTHAQRNWRKYFFLSFIQKWNGTSLTHTCSCDIISAIIFLNRMFKFVRTHLNITSAGCWQNTFAVYQNVFQLLYYSSVNCFNMVNAPEHTLFTTITAFKMLWFTVPHFKVFNVGLKIKMCVSL